jgi:hypothetical protein
MNLAVNYAKPAVALALKKYVSNPKFIGVYMSALYMCWKQGICRAVEELPPEALEDPVIKAARAAYELLDEGLAKRLYAWYVRCTGRRLVKLGQLINTGELVVLDLTRGLPEPPDWPCPQHL